MTDDITGRIVKILDETRMIANLGTQNGVSTGDRFVIYEPGEEIVDPENGESLGKLELVKAEVEAAHVQDRIVILSASAPADREQSLSKTVLSAIMAQTTSGMDRRQGSAFGVRRDQMSGMPAVKPIQIGDSVRLIERRSNKD